MNDGIPTWDDYRAGDTFNNTITTQKGNKDMKLNYNKEAADAIVTVTRTPGDYDFTIVDAKMVTAKTGNEGINATIELVNKDGEVQKCFDTFWLSDSALFRLKDLSVCVEQELPEEETDIIGWNGRASFTVNADGWYEVKKYLPKAGNSGEGAAYQGGTVEDF